MYILVICQAEGDSVIFFSNIARPVAIEPVFCWKVCVRSFSDTGYTHETSRGGKYR